MTLTLYHAPGACSRVPLIALEEAGADYQLRIVSFADSAQRTPEFLAINPKGKVPVLIEDGTPLTENPAILFRLAQRFATAMLLPSVRGGAPALNGLADLIYCAGTLHPLLHRFFRPGLYADATGEGGVRAAALAGLHDAAKKVAARLADQEWWYVDQWSIVDNYLDWVLSGADRCGFPLADYPALVAYSARVQARPAYRRALDAEARPSTGA